jgi:hypothetical protein
MLSVMKWEYPEPTVEIFGFYSRRMILCKELEAELFQPLGKFLEAKNHVCYQALTLNRIKYFDSKLRRLNLAGFLELSVKKWLLPQVHHRPSRFHAHLLRAVQPLLIRAH